MVFLKLWPFERYRQPLRLLLDGYIRLCCPVSAWDDQFPAIQAIVGVLRAFDLGDTFAH